MNISKSLKIALAIRGLKQIELAKKLNVSKSQISNWCNGQVMRPAATEKICKELNYKVSEFIALGEE